MNNFLVSILIPVYNREHLVGETIESALAQSYSNIEIIIVDNCSTDNTWDDL
jgi:glycosyltransferase involved in cell wall biosynthesis